MQGFARDGTRQERTSWRDESISRRHREWGFNCPAVDLDFLMVEYNFGLPVGIIEYKYNLAPDPNLEHPTYRALKCLADGYREPLPFLIAFYWRTIWAFRVVPVNTVARETFGHGELMTEREFVTRLYRLRRLTLTSRLDAVLRDELPSDAASANGRGSNE